jgi:ribonuclease HII
MVAARPTYDHESAALLDGARVVAGVDEAGRGPLAGPVVAAAVILDAECIPDGIADSKTLPQARRETLFHSLLSCARVSIAVVSAAEIDRINIRQATLAAMRRAVLGLSVSPCHVLIDGRDPPQLACRSGTIVGGDGTCLSIAAASIMAKVARDRIMARLSASHPGYGFDAHKGYATRAHIDALSRLGPCAAHRRSFAPVAQVEFALSG